ncbi:MAG TPA: hypothetical protein VHZ32_02540 [Rhizomicrobium sp.]|nr:hypothetical protein [Rhizomicrobium sp.]
MKVLLAEDEWVTSHGIALAQRNEDIYAGIAASGGAQCIETVRDQVI